MARNLLTITVADTAGNAVANALLTVYQTGGTTPVSDMYVASSGGSPVSTLTTGADGSVNGWFTAAQVVDLLVSDNGDGAYYSSVGSGLSTLAWASFTKTNQAPGSAHIVISTLGTVATVGNAYCTAAELKAELRIVDATDDSRIAAAVNAASRQIDAFCGQRFWQDSTVQARTFRPSHRTLLDLLEDDPTGEGVATTTGLIVKLDGDGDGTYETTLTISTDFLLEPANAAQQVPVRPYTAIRVGLPSGYTFPGRAQFPPVQVTAKWGWPAVPDDVTQACKIQAGQLFKAGDAVFGVAGFSDLGVLRVRSGLHPIAESLLRSYARPAVG